MYRIVGLGTIAIIVVLGVYFNFPKANNQIASADITVDRRVAPPDLQQIGGFINVGPLYHLSQLKGDVILLHFWRLGCGECQAEMGFINYLYKTYHPFGLVVLGIHTPQFDYEKDYNSVKQAVQEYQIKYPVLMDNNKATWSAYGDGFWPRDALIGKSGYERFTHIGNGDQTQIENNIRYLLAERNVTHS